MDFEKTTEANVKIIIKNREIEITEKSKETGVKYITQLPYPLVNYYRACNLNCTT